MTAIELLRSSGEARPRASRRTDVVMSLLCGWLVLGLFLDAFAHATIPGLESFLTPWHAVFYSGFLATAGWVLWAVRGLLLQGRNGLAAVPLGYGMTVAALPVFALSGLVDAVWHTLLGVETRTSVFFSPSHLGLIVAMVIIATSPLRSAWSDPQPPAHPSLRALLPAVVSLAFGTSLVLLFLTYGNAIVFSAESVVRLLSTVEKGGAETLVVRIVLTDLLLLAPVLLLARRWYVPFGASTLVFGMAALLSWILDGLDTLSGPLSIVAAGVGVDLLARRLRPSAARRGAYWGFAAAAGFVTWAVFLGVASAVAGRLPAVVELWTGLPIVTALVGWLLAVLMLPAVP